MVVHGGKPERRIFVLFLVSAAVEFPSFVGSEALTRLCSAQ